ncbi:TPA: DUF551 domain-containing protein [Klebsiella pneumoniae subsp. pneumoniae]|nr:DUF551 domain-containing protein [Klebsiella pneumoniae]HDS4004323.1 DUF551 domain-containing protein [Klebsiella pneumoniae subsp. pneumoniae]MBD1316285.1 DUF551 domain-containing protein [Klebsiella pneumoniae]MBZ6597636.1 DUF551 domain-containing protein [Klebsiella pneumoniae]MCX0289413.1 DUF551 domain-containing protein [Klebsiella pneumoniae]MDN0159164.1 DUF551 domain-containing protein [Klebsiella pneumoniae]
MSNFNGFTGDNDPVYYSRKAEKADGALTNEGTKQAGSSLVIPDGYVMVPKEPTDEMIHAGHLYFQRSMEMCDDFTPSGMFNSMLAAAPQSPGSDPATVPGKWIPVSERMPEKGQAVLVYRPKAHEGGDPDVRVSVYGRHNFEHGFGCYWEPSHWMPLPVAPQEEK